MKRIAIFVFALISTALMAPAEMAFANASDPSPRHYIIPEKNLALLPAKDRPFVLGRKRGLALVQMNLAQLDRLTRTLHVKRMACGGFVDVETEMGRTRDVTQLLQNAVSVPVVSRKQPTHTLIPSYPNQVSLVFSKLNEQRFEQNWRDFTSVPNRFSRGSQGPATTNWLKQKMLGWAADLGRTDITAQVISTGNGTGYTQSSVVVRVPGKDAKLPGILIGGHMDTFDGNKPGVDDDASGASTVMEIYRAVLDSRLQFSRDLYFSFYAAEELGLVGSGYVASDFKKRGVQLDGVMQLDMTAYRPGAESINFAADYTNTPLTQFTRDLAIKYVGLQPNQIGSFECGYACSDHASWHHIGMPTVLPFEATMENYNPTIHTSNDDFTKVDFKHAALFVKLGAAFVVEMAQPIASLR